MARSIRIGITGKLGTGKSILLRMMAERGFTSIRSDDLARELMERDPALRETLTALLGPHAYVGDQLDRAYVASQIFHDRALLEQVEAAVHPVVTEEIERIYGAHSDGAVAVESALILRTNFREHFDYIILIESPKEASIKRVTREGRLTRTEAEARLAEQEYGDQACAEADFTIENEGTKEEFEEKCHQLIGILETLRGRALPDAPLHAE